MNHARLWTPVLILIIVGCNKTADLQTNPAPLFVTDVDSNVYHTVTIGNQVWFRENLRTSRYRNGDSIPCISDATEWASTRTGACCNYDNVPGIDSIYGRLYNGRSVSDPRGVCPSGWHVPGQAEWKKLTGFLGGELVAGEKLKEPDSLHWPDSSTMATNETGFTALPGGYRNEVGQFCDMYFKSIFWSTAINDSSHNWYWYLYYNYSGIYKDHYHDLQHGFSIRCIYNKPVVPPH